MKKKILYMLTFLLVPFIVGCNNSSDNVNVNLFEIQEATKVVNKYMEELAVGNSEEANKMASDKVKEVEEFSKLKENKIDAYKLDQIDEGSNHAYINFKVIRSDDNKIRSNLDVLTIKVVKRDARYEIEEIKAKNNKQVYEDKSFLRIRDEESGKSRVLIRQKDLPREVYPKRENVVLGKETVEEGEFNKVALGFDGNKVGIVTIAGGKIFISLATVEETKSTVAKPSSATGLQESSDGIDKAIDDALEKPIVDKLIGYDLINGTKVDKIVFSSDDGELIIQMKEESKGSKVRIYKNPTGELLKLQLDNLFPSDKYNVNINRVNKEGLFINVVAIGEEKDSEGEYKVDLKAMKINMV